jgi:four helix bundle protein
LTESIDTTVTGARFEDLVAWQRARELVPDVYALAQEPRVARDAGFRNQIQRAAVSVMSNIAEGHERGSRAEFHQMLTIAKGSSGEVRSLLYMAMDAGMVDSEECLRLLEKAEELSRIIGGLRRTVAIQRDSARTRNRPARS